MRLHVHAVQPADVLPLVPAVGVEKLHDRARLPDLVARQALLAPDVVCVMRALAPAPLLDVRHASRHRLPPHPDEREIAPREPVGGRLIRHPEILLRLLRVAERVESRASLTLPSYLVTEEGRIDDRLSARQRPSAEARG